MNFINFIEVTLAAVWRTVGGEEEQRRGRPVRLVAAVWVGVRGSWNKGGGIKCREKWVTLRAVYLSELAGLGDVLGTGVSERKGVLMCWFG